MATKAATLPSAGNDTAPHAKSNWPCHEQDEIEAVSKVLASGRVNSLVHGDQNKAFEKEFADYVGVPFAVAVSNGTVSIELALRALGVGKGDEVIVPARSFFATTSAVVAVGATPVFAEVETDTQNIDPASVERVISDKTRAIACVHLAGQPCDMDRLCDIAERHGLFLIEDCAQAHGAMWRGRAVGSFGDAGSFSFCTDKIMSTGGEGGMLVMKDETVWRRSWAYKDHGKDPIRLREKSNSAPGEFRYCIDDFGSNFRMTEMQAAIGRLQLKKLDDWVARRRENACALVEEATKHPAVSSMNVPDHAFHTFYKCYVLLDLQLLPEGVSRSMVLAALMAEGIACGSGSCPDMSREGAFSDLEVRRDGDLAASHEMAARTIMFQVDHTLTPEDTARYGRALVRVLNALEGEA
ncbi:DegT/DnrJ/EryC1/StrS aminotransferase family protein [Erythrobacter sp. YT30]|uniref:DegT/DnrJ/EryC1/StrS family aminotransferase n=1 Tax=Erythrobacter sp. YT30 TaxID=1735012 RepID=UPI00076D2B42|nr:DegT/DnrJ/EryC1/StrS family aminotransferase [Erythrobacter sp. YT30]KWV92897.1 aminotransferase [Erythrobacter sp. YT30]